MADFASLFARGFVAFALMGVAPALAATAAAGLSAPLGSAASQAPAHRAAARPPAPGTACMDNSRYVSHVVYIPTQADQAISCGHLLSTDTMLSVRHWERT